MRVLLSTYVLLVLGVPSVVCADAEDRTLLHFNRDVRQILADKCFHCHGPDANKREADLRLDRDPAAVERPDGPTIIVAGQPDASELYRRITATDPDERMPPPDQERQLSPSETDILRRWIEQGGQYERHWAFVAPARPALPTVSNTGWPRNGIDYFVLHRLDEEGLPPAGEADKATLLRRVTLDLTGLPPTIAEADAFLGDNSPDAYERVVDRLLQSPRYGERMALDWLDAARFADSGGYQGDILRSMWLWRDWVIAACNQGLPFDQFTIEQLAGDMLVPPTQDQRIATGFHRNHRINDEDGIILEEFRVEYVVDRVETTAAVWLGLTLGCARCHDHKYDPLTQREFYQFYAYFNSVNEQGRGHGNAPPLLTVMTPELERQLGTADAKLTALRDQLAAQPNADAAARQALEQQIAEAAKQRTALAQQAPTTMVMEELPQPRETFILTRGAYDRPGEKVSPGTPDVLGPPADATQPNRLGLARWLLDPANPLTARVAVNRYWQLYFGRGLVETSEDFGTQGALPSHPDLLDWLAAEFVRSGWDVKALQRLIVTSSTYRQASHGNPTLAERDPANRWLARGPRFRLSAEMIRDQALAASGLLVNRIGGPSVRPYQPDGLWKELASASVDYEADQGANQYRRGMYTFVRRTVPHPSMIAFDAPNRELCAVRRARTTTPLQALVLMNDPTYVEAARHLAARVLREAGTDDTRLVLAFRLVLTRPPTVDEGTTLSALLNYYRQRYAVDEVAARQLLEIGQSRGNVDLSLAEHAAYTAVAMALLNLDEAVTKE